MPKSSSGRMIAVDGGGTSSRFALVWNGTRHELRQGPANVATDFDSAIATLQRGLSALAAAADIPLDRLRNVPGYLGLAGVVDPDTGRRVARAIAMPNVTVEDDRVAAVTGALGDRDGTVLGLGTGSFLARKRGQTIALLGGWGFTLGDEASGADLGRKLLRRVLHVADGLAEPGDLAATVLEELGGTPADIVAAANQAEPAWFAAFAPRIVEAARAGDPVGLELMHDGAAYLMRAASVLGWTPGEPLCPIGGLAAQYVQFLPPEAVDSLVQQRGTALDGALHLAARQQARRSR